MSKTYFGRCAAVGIAGLTAMSSIAIVASAASQASVVFEVKYGGLSNIKMNYTLGYVTGANKYCIHTGADDNQIGNGFNVSLANLLGESATYFDADGNSQKFDDVWSPSSYTAAGTSGNTTYFDGKDSFAAGAWNYKAFTATSGFASETIKLEELYGDRSAANADIYVFKTDADRTAAVSAMIANIKGEYTKLANNANAQFAKDVNDAKTTALNDINIQLKDDLATAKKTKDQAIEAAAGDKDAIKTANDDYNKTVKTTNNKYAAAKKLVTDSANKIVAEFKSTFQANNFNYNADTVFKYSNAPITYGDNVGGYTIGTTTYTGLSNGDLDNAMYWTGNTGYVDDTSYVFKGEIQPKTIITAGPSFVFIGGNLGWIKYEVIKNDSTNGGNTNPDGSKDNKKDDTKKDTTTTNWYPSSASYRAASEVSYLGENGSWYTSSSAASVYGGGYTGTSKNSNFSAVNSAADGKAIYFNSTTGTYSTSSSTYSYVVKEATTTTTDTNNDPYYSYFFNNGNKNNTTTSVPAGSPAISGASKYAGWTNISAYITNRAKSGATYTINMNDGTVVPAAVLAAAKAKNVTLVFANDNGSKVTVKPGKVSTTSDLNVAVTYNVKDVKSSLVKKAKKVNKGTVSTAQVRIGTDGSIGGTETVTVKFSKKRSGCTVKAYRLTESGSLKKEATGTVASTGRANLNLTKGGSYLLVVIDD